MNTACQIVVCGSVGDLHSAVGTLCRRFLPCHALNGRFAETSAERTDGEVKRGFSKPAIEGKPSG